MKIFDLDKEQYENRPKAIALGNFDGFHIAHREIIKNMLDNSSNLDTSVLLFKDHTYSNLNKTIKVLSNLDTKLKIIDEVGINTALIVSFGDIKDKSPKEFLDFLTNDLNVQSIFVGYDYTFGNRSSGDINYLKHYCFENNIKLSILDPISERDQLISSTYIRELIKEKKFEQAERLLGSEYFVTGTVIEGKNLGKKLGFPTANLQLDEDYVLPSPGVYYAQVSIDNKIYDSATSLGINLTFDDEVEQKIESHILDFEGNLYGKTIAVRFIQKIREMMRFDDLNHLQKQVISDIKDIKRLGEEYGHKENQ